tara:strand:- start:209 stop:1423 length:1215 start_codon:yes stop_codon:yes gene_type:complete
MDDPIVSAVLYRAALDKCDPSEPLFGIPYVGQTVGTGDPQWLANQRWKAEISQAKRENHDVGFLAALKRFGDDCFDWAVVESKKAPRGEAQEWADKREIALIAENGGPLRDMDTRLHQTLNLTKGGKTVDSNHWWFAKEALCTKVWKTFQAGMNEYLQLHGTALVPFMYVSPTTGYRLGQNVRHVRRGCMLEGRIDETQRRLWLNSLPGWKWKAREDSLKAFREGKKKSDDLKFQVFQTEMDEYVRKFGTARVPRAYVAPSLYPLGRKVGAVRSRKLFVSKGGVEIPERMQWVNSLPGWTWNAKETNKRMRVEAIDRALDSKKSKLLKRQAKSERNRAKQVADIAALRSTIEPAAKFNELTKYRRDGSVAKAHRRLAAQAAATAAIAVILDSVDVNIFGASSSA